jgi:hypothetical protein
MPLPLPPELTMPPPLPPGLAMPPPHKLFLLLPPSPVLGRVARPRRSRSESAAGGERPMVAPGQAGQAKMGEYLAPLKPACERYPVEPSTWDSSSAARAVSEFWGACTKKRNEAHVLLFLFSSPAHHGLLFIFFFLPIHSHSRGRE